MVFQFARRGANFSAPEQPAFNVGNVALFGRSALAPNATAALVMAQIAGLTHLGHEHAVELATSWSAYGRRYVDDQEKYREAEAVLLTAFQTRQREGESA